MTDTTSQFKRQLPRNSLFQALSFAVQVGVGIWLVPYLVNHLGTAAYGLIPLAGMLTEYASLVSQSVSIAVNRDLTIALQQDDTREASCVFSTAFLTYVIAGALQIPVFAVMIHYADVFVAIPADLHADAVILLACSATAFVVNLLGGVFGVPMYACNRLDLSRGLDIGRQVFRVAGIAVLFTVAGPALRYVGYVDLAISLALFVSQVVIARVLVPTLRLGLSYCDRRKITQPAAMGGWLLVNNLGAMLFLRVDVWICNRFISPEAAGEYATVLPWSALIRSGGATIAAVVAPMIMIYYARSQMAEMTRLSRVAIRILSLAVAVPTGVICAFSPQLLRFWLGESFVHLSPLVVVMLAPLVINVGVLPLLNIQVTMNKVRAPALMTLVMGGLNVLLAVMFVVWFGWGLWGVAAAGAIVLTAKNAVWTPFYTSRITGQPWHTFASPYLSALLLLTGMILLGSVLGGVAASCSLNGLVLIMAAAGGVGLAAAWLVLPSEDRRMVLMLTRRGAK